MENGDLKKTGELLHRDLLSTGSPDAVREIYSVFCPVLINRLKARFRGLRDPHYLETAANDALNSYFKQPGLFDPAKGSLTGYLLAAAYRKLADILKRDRRRGEFESGGEESELAAIAATGTPESELIEADSRLVGSAKSLLTDPRDLRILELMMEGTRETSEYAEVLGIRHLSSSEQTTLVKKNKDRIKIYLRRKLGRLIALILGWLTALRQKARGASRRTKAMAASAGLVLLLVSGVPIWKALNLNRALRWITTSRPERAYLDAQEKLRRGIAEGWAAEKVFFSSNRTAAPGTSQSHIWMMKPDGTSMEHMTLGPFSDLEPALSPDGTKLAFSRAGAQFGSGTIRARSIWVRDLISGAETPITAGDDLPSGPYSSHDPAWSPDGSRIAFQRNVAEGEPEDPANAARIWVMGYTDTTPARPLSSPSCGAPCWSIDGGHILHMHKVMGYAPFAVYKVSVATGKEEEVIPYVRGEYVPKYSPDGSRIAWTTFRHSNFGDVYVTKAADPKRFQTRVSPHSGCGQPAWSPDGNRLIFAIANFKVTERTIQALGAMGAPQTVLSGLGSLQSGGFLTEDELLILLKRTVGEELTGRYGYKITQQCARQDNLWKATADGQEFTRLTSGPPTDDHPCWGRIVLPGVAKN